MKKTIPLIILSGVTTSHAAVFSSGELDFGVILEGGELEFEAHVVSGILDNVQTDDVEFSASEIQVLVGEDREFTATTSRPASGVGVGDSLWQLPQNQEPGVPYLALASEELNVGDWTNSMITFTLGSVTSPSGSGTFSAWSNDDLGGRTYHFSSAGDGLTANSNQFFADIDPGHYHLNWGFTEPGTWSVEVTASGTLAPNTPLSATETLTFIVIPEPSTSLLAGISILGFLVRRKR